MFYHNFIFPNLKINTNTLFFLLKLSQIWILKLLSRLIKILFNEKSNFFFLHCLFNAFSCKFSKY